MSILVAVLLNCGLLALIGPWLSRQYRHPVLGRLLLPLLGLKVVACLIACWLLSDDADYFQRWSLSLTTQLWEAPGAWLRTLFGDAFEYRGQRLVFHGYSNTFFIIKLLSVLNMATLGSLWANGLYLSLFGFMGGWELTKTLNRLFPLAPVGAPVVAFLLWPTVVYWTAGLTKECLLVGSGTWLLALVLGWLYNAEKPRPGQVLGAVLLAVLHFKMRYFFAVLLFAALSGLAVVRVAQHLSGTRRRWVAVLLFAAVLVLGGWAGSEVSPVFRLNKFTSQLIRTYSDLREGSGRRPHIEYDDLAPTVPSLLRNAPKAVVSAVVRPWPWEDSTPLYVAAGLENVLLIFVLLVAGVATLRGKWGQLPFALILALGFYCLVLAALLGLSTPNLGTLNRYRAVMLPYLILLALQNEYAARWLRRIGL
ncbi:hypothetical protein [Hymenobacter chitinivorans]|uniref:Uncharacterized protein n=1 Tax=Hymenobacter chitinivorans DSM 11115 TaxID=1121954 RepID=A0A2M9BQ99_9BACT|nr:hypothetical protein [Hymenobacter chitinivorans]PJJ60140.1 hypothetical protein CLV45_1565 [Hymenobacter chitinivorans DSM 11115]